MAITGGSYSQQPFGEAELSDNAASLGSLASEMPDEDGQTPKTGPSTDLIPHRELPDDEDQSIDEYLSRLLTRVCGEEAARDYARNREIVGTSNSVGNTTAAGMTARPTSFGSHSVANEAPSDARFQSALAHVDQRREPTRLDRPILDHTTGHEPQVAMSPDGDGSTGRKFDYVAVSAGIAAIPGSPLVPRVTTPETQVDLTQLRALANASARTAIAAHVNRLRLQSARSKLFSLVLFAISATIGLYVADGDQLWSLVGVLGAYLLAAAWLIRAIRLAQTIPSTSELDALNGLAPTRGAH
ncbi:MAG TPA: hypothetical protein PLV92_23110 [Pirellulaceae bacterium]|nr:hypothetical protein [Pirellulaceae bacterium]